MSRAIMEKRPLEDFVQNKANLKKEEVDGCEEGGRLCRNLKAAKGNAKKLKAAKEQRRRPKAKRR